MDNADVSGIDWVGVLLSPAIISLVVTILIGVIYRLVDTKVPRLAIYVSLPWGEVAVPVGEDPEMYDNGTVSVTLVNAGDDPAFNIAVLPYGCGWQFDPQQGNWGIGKNGGAQNDSWRSIIQPGEAILGRIYARTERISESALIITWEQRTPFRGIRPRSWLIPLWDIPPARDWHGPIPERFLRNGRGLKWFTKFHARDMRSDALTPPRRWPGCSYLRFKKMVKTRQKQQ